MSIIYRFIDIQLQLTDAKGQILDLEDRNDQLSKALTSLEGENSHLTSNLDKLHRLISSKEDDLAETTQELLKLQQVESNQNEMLTVMKEKVRKCAAEEDRQKREHSETHRELQEMQSNYNRLTAEIRELTDKYSNALIALHGQEDANRVSALELNKVKDELKMTQQQLTIAKQSEIVLVKQCEETSARLHESCSNIRSELDHTHKIELDTLNCDKKHLTEENSRILVKFENCSNELNAAKKINNEVSSKLQQSLADLTEERRQCELVQGQLDEVSSVWLFVATRTISNDSIFISIPISILKCIQGKDQLLNENRFISEKVRNLESRLETAAIANWAEKDTLQRQLEEANKSLNVERHRHEASLNELEDSIVSYTRDLIRSKRL